jgi:uncharacterized membrane protein (DUF4010 family)
VAGLSLGTLSAAVLIASSSNNLAKAAYALGFGGAQASRPAAMLFILALAGFVAAAVSALCRLGQDILNLFDAVQHGEG